jgi:hypothetical protein
MADVNLTGKERDNKKQDAEVFEDGANKKHESSPGMYALMCCCQCITGALLVSIGNVHAEMRANDLRISRAATIDRDVI